MLVKHVIEQCHLPLFVADDWELEVAATDLVDVLDPTAVTLDRVGRKTDEFHSTPGELGLKLGESTELSGTDRSIVLWMGEEDDPVIADEFMEADGTGSRLSIEIGSDVPQAQTTRCQSLFFRVVG